MGGAGGDRQESYLAKRWSEEFSKNYRFEEDIPFVEKKRSEHDFEYNDIEIFMRDHDDDDDDEDCAITDVKEFCGDVKLEILSAGDGIAGNRQAACLDDRSAGPDDVLDRVREYDQPLTATGLYRHLKEKVYKYPSYSLGKDPRTGAKG